ncbi:MAG: hypothetical protein VKK04_08090 [Synechococcales bacterium]|nr:hypothetical protein [Synechococcales bacterium]
MPLIQRKPIRTTVRRIRLCLVIPLGGGVKVQYPVDDETEAQVLYNEFLQLNAQTEGHV